MRKLLWLVVLAALVAGAFVLGRHWPTGVHVNVLFRDGEGIQRGDPVTWNEVEIGQVDRVSTEGDRVRVGLRLSGAEAHKLPARTTFEIRKSDGGRRVVAHVLAESPPIADGATVDGVRTALEAALRKGAEQVAVVVARAADSDWVKQGREKVDGMRREVEAIDWDAVSRDARERARVVSDQLTELAGKTEDEARRLYEKIRPEIERLLRELEALGRSEEARKLRERVRELWHGAVGG